MPGQHSILSPSSSSRWFECPGSTDAFYLPETTTNAADRGTEGHAVCSELLLAGRKSDDPETLDRIKDYDEPMQRNIRAFLDAADHYTNGFRNKWETEVRMESWKIPDLGGTTDLITIDGKTLIVGDAKFGRIIVEAEGNTQLMCYLILALERPEYAKATKFVGYIVQNGEVDEAVFTRHQLNKAKKRIAYVAEAKERVPGGHCQWCPLLRTCNEAKTYTYQLALETFDRFETLDAVVEDDLTVEDAKKFIEWGPVAGKLAELGKKKLRSAMLAGHPVEGWKLGVRQSNREWRDEEQCVVNELVERGVPEENLYKKTLLSPTQAEVILGKKAVDDLVTRRDTAVVAVPKRSRLREYVSGEAILEEFEPWSDENDGR